MGDPCWSSLFLKDDTPWKGSTLEQSVPERLHPMEGTHEGAVLEGLHLVGRTHVGAVCGGLSLVRRTQHWSRGRV